MFYVAFNIVQVISRQVVRRAEENSTYSPSGFCTVNCQPTASNYPAFPLEAMPGTEPRPQRWEARVLPLCHRGPLTMSKNKKPRSFAFVCHYCKKPGHVFFCWLLKKERNTIVSQLFQAILTDVQISIEQHLILA